MLNWGVLGLGNIAHRFVESLQHFDEARFYAGASHTEAKRNEFQEKYHPVKVYDDYMKMLEDPDIDAVYIAVPHGLHYKWAMEAMKHEKCVLVEKPAALTREEIVALTDYSREHHVFFMEAMKSRFIPMMNVVKKEIEDGVIGDIISIDNAFTYKIGYKEGSYLFDKKMGGALYDTGIYCIAAILDFIKSPVKDIDVLARIKYDVDVFDYVSLVFEDGKKANFECAMDSDNKRMMVIKGTKGKITMDPFYRPTEATIELDNGESMTGMKSYEFDDFHGEIAAVHNSLAYIKYENERMSHQDSIDCITLMETIRNKIYE